MGGTPCFVHHLFAVVKGKKKMDRWFSAVLMYMIWEACIGGTSCTPDIICLTYVGFYICFLGTIIKQRTCSPFFFYEKQIVCLGNVSTLQFL
jgi:hypothetical protein